MDSNGMPFFADGGMRCSIYLFKEFTINYMDGTDAGQGMSANSGISRFF